MLFATNIKPSGFGGRHWRATVYSMSPSKSKKFTSDSGVRVLVLADAMLGSRGGPFVCFFIGRDRK
jgi:hypothetical protein